MLQLTDEQFNKLKLKSEEFYKSIGEVHCPYFKEKIIFNAKGLEHLKFKSKIQSYGYCYYTSKPRG